MGAQLNRCEWKEFEIGAARFALHGCQACGAEHQKRTESCSHSICPACQCCTMHSSTIRLRIPSEHVEGIDSVTEKCELCGRKDSFQRRVPKIVPTYSSSSHQSNWNGGSS